jgi:DNA end-binding protein Ku
MCQLETFLSRDHPGLQFCHRSSLIDPLPRGLFRLGDFSYAKCIESSRFVRGENMARPLWSGNLQISLVSFGIGLIPATSPASEISFHQIDRNTGQRVRHQNVVDDNPVEASEIVKGYEISKGKYITIEPKEIDELRIESRSTLELTQFVDLTDLPLALFEKPYFVVPEPSEQTAAYTIVLHALEQTGKAGLGEIAFAGREHLVAIAAAPGKQTRGLMAYTLRYAQELRDPSEYFPSIPRAAVDKKQMAMAVDLIHQYSDDLDLSAFKDDYEAALRKLIEAKLKKKPLPLETGKPQRAKVINLADALRRSLGKGQKRSTGSVSPSRATARKGPGATKSTRRSHRAA